MAIKASRVAIGRIETADGALDKTLSDRARSWTGYFPIELSGALLQFSKHVRSRILHEKSE